jgi:hypothetical protein
VRGEEVSDTAVVVDRLDQLDSRRRIRAGRQEAEPHPLRGEHEWFPLGPQAE